MISPCIWKPKVPSKVVFFAWTAALGKILMIDNLCVRKLWNLDWCYMCKCGRELVDHLLLHCPIVRDQWDIYGICYVWDPVGDAYEVDLLACWQGQLGRHHNYAILEAIPHYLT